MKKLFYPLACMLICTSPAQAKHYFTGFLLAGAVGGTNVQYSLDQDLSATSPLFEVTLPDDSDISANSPAVMVSLGYAHQFMNNMVLGGAFTAGYAYAQVSDSISSQVDTGTAEFTYTRKTELTFSNDFALLFKPGYVFGTSTQFYGLIGPRWGNFKSSVKTSINATDGTDVYTASDSESASNYEIGITVGLGIQQLISPNYSWALEYAFTNYGNIDTPDSSGTFLLNGVPEPGATYTDSPNVSATTNTLMFSFAVRY